MKTYLFLLGVLLAGIAKAQTDTTVELKKNINGKLYFVTKKIKITTETIDSVPAKNAERLPKNNYWELNTLGTTSVIGSNITIWEPFNWRDYRLYATRNGSTIQYTPGYEDSGGGIIAFLHLIFILLSILAISGDRENKFIFTAILMVLFVGGICFSTYNLITHTYPISFFAYFSFPITLISIYVLTLLGFLVYYKITRATSN